MLAVAVLAGGLGTRLREITGETLPKVLVPVRGKPFIDYKLAGLAAAGVERVVLLVGHQAEQIRAHIGNGERYGLKVSFVDDGRVLRGTGGALLHALEELTKDNDAFWVTYGDTLLDVPMHHAEATFASSGLPALMTVFRNFDKIEPSNVRVDGGLVAEYGKDPRPRGAEYIDYGMLAFQRDAFAAWCDSDSFDLGAMLEVLIARRSVLAFEVTQRFHDVGTVEALRETEVYLSDHAG